MDKIISYIIILCLTLPLYGCNSKPSEVQQESAEGKKIHSQTDDSRNGSTQNDPLIQNMDFSDCFNNLQGSCVFYNSELNEYRIYNQAESENQYSPCSTFKIIASMLGVEAGVLVNENSKMKYNGSTYPIDSWNKDLTLKEAFQSSCVWYFKQVIDKVGENEVKKKLTELDYGNCDVSEWDGSALNPTPDTNGFWLESSLKISPKEQVDVLSKIFDGHITVSESTLSLLKQLMLVDNDEGISLYGKTGTGKNNAWFVGFFEDQKQRWYFTVNLQDENNVSGNNAKEIVTDIIEEHF